MAQINKSRYEKGDLITAINDTHGIIREDFENISQYIGEKKRKTGKFLESCNLPKLSQEDINNLNRLIMSSDIETVIKKCDKESPGQAPVAHACNPSYVGV
jgi:hypothetical protein